MPFSNMHTHTHTTQAGVNVVTFILLVFRGKSFSNGCEKSFHLQIMLRVLMAELITTRCLHNQNLAGKVPRKTDLAILHALATHKDK